MLFQRLANLRGSLLLAAGQYASRPDGLPWMHAPPAGVEPPATSGDITRKDAAMPFLSGKALFLDTHRSSVLGVERRPGVRTHMSRQAAFPDQPCRRLDHPPGPNDSGHVDGQAFPPFLP